MSDYPQAIPQDPSHAPVRRIAPRPTLTTVLIAINVLVFVAMVATTGALRDFTTAQVIKWGADWGPLTLGDSLGACSLRITSTAEFFTSP